MNRFLLVALAGVSLALSTGCATKNYARSQTTPLINKTNELDDRTAQNTRDLRDFDARTQQGVADVNARAAAADEKAMAAGRLADQAQLSASRASTGVNVLTNQVANLDNYHVVNETSVKFGFNQATLTKQSKEDLDNLAASIGNTPHWILALEGGADSVGSQDYNYGLSQRRADAVVQYLAQAHDIPAHKIYVIGLGKDRPVASNSTSAGRAENRRVEVRLMSSNLEAPATAAAAPAKSTPAPTQQ